jgi:elongation factor P--beta-lysine ligase
MDPELREELARLFREFEKNHMTFRRFEAEVAAVLDQIFASPPSVSVDEGLLSALKELADAGAEAWGEDRPCVKFANEAIQRAEASKKESKT